MKNVILVVLAVFAHSSLSWADLENSTPVSQLTGRRIQLTPLCHNLRIGNLVHACVGAKPFRIPADTTQINFERYMGQQYYTFDRATSSGEAHCNYYLRKSDEERELPATQELTILDASSTQSDLDPRLNTITLVVEGHEHVRSVHCHIYGPAQEMSKERSLGEMRALVKGLIVL